MKREHFVLLPGMVLLVAGGWLFAANLDFLPAQVFPPTALLASLGIGLAGVALLFAPAEVHVRRNAQLAVGCVLLALAASAWFAKTVPFDMAATPDGDAIALAFTALAMIAVHLARLPGALIQLILLLLVAMGLLGVVGYLLDIALLYPGYAEVHVSLPMAAALLLCAGGLWLQSYGMDWHHRYYGDRDDRRITLITAVVLLAVAISAGLSGFALVAATTQKALTDSLMVSLENRVRAFDNEIEYALENIKLAASRPRFNILMAKMASQGISAAERQEIESILDDIISKTPIHALVLYDTRGEVYARRGTLHTNPAFEVALPGNQASLLWQKASVLRARVPMQPNGSPVGLLEGEVPLPEIDQMFHDFAGLGESGSMGVCAASGEGIVCMPSRANNYRVIRTSRYFDGKPVPMNQALAGKTGYSKSVDVHGAQVISAQGPIGSLGLGMIVKVHAAEIYEPIKRQLGYTLGAILALAIAGMLLLRWQITPLAHSLVMQIRERRLAERRLSHLAHHDSLTGLPNRALFHDRLRLAMIDANRRVLSVAVMFLDVDRFKAVNDTIGHEAGDDLLKQIAVRLTSCLRSGDTVSRLGGDEFAVVLPALGNSNDVRMIAERMIYSFERPFMVHGHEVFVTGSIGITLYPEDEGTEEGLLKNADTAMYRAKDLGRNNYQFYSAEMHAQMVKRMSLESQLRGAIERHELVLHYQPLVDIRTEKIFGMEALVRWQHPTLGLVPPAEFISIAEEIGLIVPIGEWVLRTACAQAQAWQEEGFPPLRLSVNISARQCNENLAETVLAVLGETGLDPYALELELTESAVMENPEKTLSVFDMLDRIGVKLAIDDFGTGYSSLSYLQRFRIDTLKIDRSFIRDIPGNADDVLIAAGIIGLAHSLGLTVVAEGVETAEQLDFLNEQHCDAGQGYYFGKPMRPEEFAALVRKQNQ